MLGALAGDIVGSVYENLRTKRKDFRLFTPVSTFTDDTVLTVAVADAILTGRDYGSVIKSYARAHPLRGYGPRFLLWMASPGLKPYNSFGNGSAIRVSPVAHAFASEAAVLDHAKRTAECTHNHPEGLKGAEATAVAIFMARYRRFPGRVPVFFTNPYKNTKKRNCLKDIITPELHYLYIRNIRKK